MIIPVLFVLFAGVAFGAPSIDNGPRVVGGSNAAEGQFPYQVSIRDRLGHFCGGSILDETTIISAAHCVIGQYELDVVVGTTNLNGDGGDVYRVKWAIKHELYDNFFKTYDISLLKLAEPIKFNEKVQPVELRQTEIRPDEECTLSGWGHTTVSGSSPEILQFIKLKTIDYETCKERMSGFLIFESQLCTFTKVGEGACNGDSGGPLVDSLGRQVGIVSWGIPCAKGRPDIFVRMTSVLDWIEEHRY